MLRTILFGKTRSERVEILRKQILRALLASYPQRLSSKKVANFLGYSPAIMYGETSFAKSAMQQLEEDGLVVKYDQSDVGKTACGYELSERGLALSRELDGKTTESLMPIRPTGLPTVGSGPFVELFPDLVKVLKGRFVFIGSIMDEYAWVNSVRVLGEKKRSVQIYIEDTQKRKEFHPNFLSRMESVARTVYGEDLIFNLEGEKMEVSSEGPEQDGPGLEETPASSLMGRIVNVLADMLGEESLEELEGMRLQNDKFIITIAQRENATEPVR